MWKEFKEFAFKGNVLDMSIGVIIGSAFGKIVSFLYFLLCTANQQAAQENRRTGPRCTGRSVQRRIADRNPRFAQSTAEITRMTQQPYAMLCHFLYIHTIMISAKPFHILNGLPALAGL